MRTYVHRALLSVRLSCAHSTILPFPFIFYVQERARLYLPLEIREGFGNIPLTLAAEAQSASGGYTLKDTLTRETSVEAKGFPMRQVRSNLHVNYTLFRICLCLLTNLHEPHMYVSHTHRHLLASSVPTKHRCSSCPYLIRLFLDRSL